MKLDKNGMHVRTGWCVGVMNDLSYIGTTIYGTRAEARRAVRGSGWALATVRKVLVITVVQKPKRRSKP